MSKRGARYVLRVLSREASFEAIAIRISTLPIRLSSLTSGDSMLDISTVWLGIRDHDSESGPVMIFDKLLIKGELLLFNIALEADAVYVIVKILWKT